MSQKPTFDQVWFLINTKVRKLQKKRFSSVTYKQVEQTLVNGKWQGKIPAHLSTVASDVAALTIQDVVDYITRDGVPSDYDFDSLEGE